jgi:single-stranded DNA-binding protein
MNTFCGVGRLTRNPAGRFEDAGVMTATATLLIEEAGKERAFRLFVPLSFWGKPAEAVSTMGAEDLLSVTGKLCWRRVHTKSGEDKSSLAVEVKTVVLLQAAHEVEVCPPWKAGG